MTIIITTLVGLIITALCFAGARLVERKVKYKEAMKASLELDRAIARQAKQ